MRPAIELLRKEPRARIFFGALAQSSLGTGAAYIALLLVAYDRFRSPWAIGLVLLADVVPAMVLGPIFGAAADRYSRKAAVVIADLLRAIAFLGIALVDSFAATLALAVLAGVGTGLFTPAALAGLPSVLQEERRLPAATSLYGAVTDLGFTAGPALAALVLLAGGPEWILLGNAATFAIGAALLAGLRFGTPPPKPAEGEWRSLLREAREGLRATAGMQGLRVVLVASAVALFFGGLFNVAELLLANNELGAGNAGYAILVAVYGLGFISGSLAGSGGGALERLKQRYRLGLLIMGGGFAISGLAPNLGLALGAFAVAGFGNGLVLVYERLLIQALVPDRLSGRVFGVKDALTAWAFALSFAAGAAVLSLLDTRATIVLAGVGGLVVWLVTAAMLRSTWSTAPAGPPAAAYAGELAGGAERLLHRRGGEDGPDVVRGLDHWLTLLDDLRDGGDDRGVELSPRVRR